MRGLTPITVIIFSATVVEVVVTKVVASMYSSSKSIAAIQGSRNTHGSHSLPTFKIAAVLKQHLKNNIIKL